MYITSQLAGKGYKASVYTAVITIMQRYKQTYNNCAETHLDGGVINPFDSLWSTIAQVHDPTVISIVALRKGPQRFCPNRMLCTDAYWC